MIYNTSDKPLIVFCEKYNIDINELFDMCNCYIDNFPALTRERLDKNVSQSNNG